MSQRFGDRIRPSGRRRARLFALLGTLGVLSTYLALPTSPTTAAEPSAVVDDFESGLPQGSLGGGANIGYWVYQDPDSSASIATTTAAPADSRPDAPADNDVLALTANINAWSAFAHTFENASVDAWVTKDWSGYAGIRFWMYGTNSGTNMFLDVLDNRNPDSTTDDAERFTKSFVDDFTGWKQISVPFSDLTRKEIGNGAPNDGLQLNAVHGWGFGTLATNGEKTFYVDQVEVYGVATVAPLSVSFESTKNNIAEGKTGQIVVKLNRPMNADDPASVTVDYATEDVKLATPGTDYVTASGTLTFTNGGAQTRTFDVVTKDDTKFEGTERIALRLSNFVNVKGGFATQSSAFVIDNEAYDSNLLDDFEQGAAQWKTTGPATDDIDVALGSANERPRQDQSEKVLSIGGAGTVSRTFPIGQDFSGAESVRLWYKGTGSGEPVTVVLHDNEAPDPGPSGWQLAWQDEFNEAAGTPPNPDHWTFEIGDVTPDGKNGWGNDELQYYTDDPANASTDGEGNLKITVREATGGQQCYYGPCKYTSARLISADKAEFAYGKIETRLRVPQGGGIWPAFWSLGNDIERVPWPKTGEIDIMEHVGRLPNEIFGTIHGPGYAGGESYGKKVVLEGPVAADYHTYAIEWQPNEIRWYFDGTLYHTAKPTDDFMSGKEWVFNDPVFLLLNVAMGGNFGGAVADDFTAPQSMDVDYVKVYQAPDSAERFEATFSDDTAGWKQVTVPFTSFTRSADQPADAPNDGLTLDDVNGISLKVPGAALADVIEIVPQAAPTSLVVTNTNDSGEGSLRDALAAIADGGTVTFDQAVSGGTISLESQLEPANGVTIDASSVSGLTIDGQAKTRILEMKAGLTVNITDVDLKNGAGGTVGGCVLNKGTLNLTRVVVSGCRSDGDPAQWWQGGGGIYTDEGASLVLTNSTVADNTSGGPGGGLYLRQNATLTMVGSTLSGNSSQGVAGGLRSLGNATLTNSTVSGNTAGDWLGGGIFATDGDVKLSHTTVTGNSAPTGGGGVTLAGFGASSATLRLTSSIVDGNTPGACYVHNETSGTLTLSSGGTNVVSDDSCAPVASDIVNASAMLKPLADNGGDTLTHALTVGSPAIDVAVSATCPAADQTGASRPIGDGCDVGAVEFAESPIETTTTTVAPTTTTTVAPTTTTTVAPTTTTTVPTLRPEVIPVVPSRLLDTRPEWKISAKGTEIDGLRTMGDETRLKVVDRGGVPSDAKGVFLSVTAALPVTPGHVIVYPCGQRQLKTSNLNLTPNLTQTNAVFVEVGDGGNVCLYTHGTTHLVVDVNGYTTRDASLEAEGPARLLDTRREWPAASAVKGKRTMGSRTEIKVTEVFGVPADAEGVLLNLTAPLPDTEGHLIVYPCSSPRPKTSNLNLNPGVTDTNAVWVKVGTSGTVCLYTHGTTDAIVDLAGYAPAGSFQMIPAKRLVDTRPQWGIDDNGPGIDGVRKMGQETKVKVAGRGGVPADATAVALNITTPLPLSDGHLIVYPCGAKRPQTSNLNLNTGMTDANTVFMEVGANGEICIYSHGTTDLIVDVGGFVPKR